MPIATQIPVPRGLELPLPLGEWELKAILVVLFLIHILFVNLMVGGSVFAVFFEILGLTWPKYDSLAKKIAHTITVNKSLAVVMGVGPLLCINLVYTTHFYSANALTGYAWWSIVPLISLAFLLTYLHKYTWDRWQNSARKFHLMIGGSGTLLFLSIPFIFLSNINLMLFPDRWSEVAGLFSSLRVGNVFPRYFHFLTASLALTSLFLAGWFGRKRFPVEDVLPDFSRAGLKRLFYRMAFFRFCSPCHISGSV
jgi:cytochrome c